jgi:glycine cleavage system H protein
MSQFFYTTTHEWIADFDGQWRVGLSEFAVGELGDVTAVDLPDVGATFKKGDVIGAVESPKGYSDVYAPVDLTVSARNEEIINTPELVNQEPLARGYLITVTPADASQVQALMKKDAYDAFCAEGGGH